MTRLIIKASVEVGESSNGFSPGIRNVGARTRYAPINKLRAQARAGLGEFQAEQIALQRMLRTTTETADIPRHVVLIDDVTRGLGLNVVDEQRIQKAISSTNVEFTTKTQTQRIFLARGMLGDLLRSMREVPGEARLEISKRATAWWRKEVDTELVRSRTVPFISYARSQMGKSDLAKGVHQYKSKKFVGGRWQYDYGKGHEDKRSGRHEMKLDAKPHGTNPADTSQHDAHVKSLHNASALVESKLAAGDDAGAVKSIKKFRDQRDRVPSHLLSDGDALMLDSLSSHHRTALAHYHEHGPVREAKKPAKAPKKMPGRQASALNYMARTGGTAVPGGTGMTYAVGSALSKKGLISVEKWGQYSISDKGKAALEQHNLATNIENGVWGKVPREHWPEDVKQKFKSDKSVPIAGWIRVRGARVPHDKNGKLMGALGEKLMVHREKKRLLEIQAAMDANMGKSMTYTPPTERRIRIGW